MIRTMIAETAVCGLKIGLEWKKQHAKMRRREGKREEKGERRQRRVQNGGERERPSETNEMK